MISIEKLEELTKEGEEKYFKAEISATYEIFLKCQNQALKINDPEWIGETTKNLGRILHRMGRYEEAKQNYLKALEIVDKHSFISKKARYLNHLSNVYQFTNEFDKQFQCLTEALKISETLNDDYNKAKILNSFGVYYEIFGDYDHALKFMEKAIEYFKDHQIEYALLKSYNLITSLKTKQKNFEDAYKYGILAYQMAKDTNDIYNLAYSLRNIIQNYYDQEKYGECLEFLNELLEIKDNLENKKMGCDILLTIGQVFQKDSQLQKSFDTLNESLTIAKNIQYYHGIAKANEFLGDLFYENKRYLEAYRYYSNSLNSFHLIFNSIKDQKLKRIYEISFERLPEIIQKVDSILEERSFELSSNDLNQFSNDAISLCKQLRQESINETISKECSNNVKKFNSNKSQELEDRDRIKKEWISTLSNNCFMKLDKDTQDYLIRYKINVNKTPDDYESIIRKLCLAIECEIRIKLFEGFRSFWYRKMHKKLKLCDDESLHINFVKTYNKLKSFLEEDTFLDLGQLYFILSAVYSSNSIKNVDTSYIEPFKQFRQYIGENNIPLLQKIIDFFNKKYPCGKSKYQIVFIRNKISHGGGRFQEKRKRREINIGKDTFEIIEKDLLNTNIKLLSTLCSLDIVN